MDTPQEALKEASSEEISILIKDTTKYFRSRQSDIWYDAVLRFLEGNPSCPVRKRGTKRNSYSAAQYEQLLLRLNVYLFQVGKEGKLAFERYTQYLEDSRQSILTARFAVIRAELTANSSGMTVGKKGVKK